MDISLNKYISDSGFCSRREADKYIEECRVTINDKDAQKGNRVNEGDVVKIDGEGIKKKKAAVYLLLNKPKGITCTTDLKDKTNIVDFVNYKTRIFPIGRLDKLSEGLIFLTNDGDIVDKTINPDFINKMRNGVKIPGAVTQKCFVKQEGDNRFKIVLTQGLNRQIRRMCEALGYRVTALKRTRIMNISISGLQPGKWRYFTPQEISSINEMLKDSSKTDDSDGMGE